MCPVVVLLSRTANKGDDQQMFLMYGTGSHAKQRNRLKMATLFQSGSYVPNRRHFSWKHGGFSRPAFDLKPGAKD